MKLTRTKKGRFFFKYFIIFSALLLLSTLISGTALIAFIGNFLKQEALSEISTNAKSISALFEDIMDSNTYVRNPEGASMMLFNTIDLMSNCTGSDVLICNREGSVAACRDILSDSFEFSEDTVCPKHGHIKVPQRYIDRVNKNGGYTEFSTLGNIYSSMQAIAFEPIKKNGVFLGFTMISSPVSQKMLYYLKQIVSCFLIISAIALVLVTIVVYLLTDRITSPIRQLAVATRCYAKGDFSYRIPIPKAHDDLSELAIEFNSMASSLAELENSRRSFVANVSHEFKTPMTTIGGFIDGILDGTIPPEKESYYLGIVSAEVKRLSRMVNMMLNISRIESGNLELKLEQVNISSKLISTLLGFEQLVSDKNINIEGLEDLGTITARADSAMIDQVIYNLIDNAVKFTESGGRILVNTFEEKRFAYFSITNSGKGIPEKDLSKVFERFYKVDKSRSTDTKSTGLGLFLIKSIVELHNGTVTVESKEDDFTRFTVKLPK